MTSPARLARNETAGEHSPAAHKPWWARLRSALPGRRPPEPPPPPPPAPDDDDGEEQRYRPIDRVLLRRTLGLLAPYRRAYALGLTLGAAQTVLEMLSPKFTQWVIDYGDAYVRRTLRPMPDEHGAIAHVCWIVAIWAVVLAAAIVLQRFTILVMTGAGERVQFGIRRRLFDQLQRLSMSYYDKTQLGRIISRSTSDVNAMRDVNVWGMHTVAVNLLSMLIAAIMLVTTDVRLFLSVAWLGVVLWLANRFYLRKAAGMYQMVREGWTRVSTNMAENITGMRVVAAFDRQGTNLGAFNELQARNTANNVDMARVNGVYLPLLQLIAFVGKVIVLSFGGYLLVTGRMSKGVGAVVAAFLYWDSFMNPIQNLGNFHNLLMQAMAGAERVFSLLDLEPDVRDEPTAAPLPRIVGRVEFDHVTFGYNPDRPVLHDISFVATPGQTVALVGHTGSGKSSIVSLIARFYQPQSGRVLVDGHDVRHVTGDSLHRQMGLVLQTNYLFGGTVMQNVRYARPEASDADVEAAARAVGAHDAILALRDGYATEVGERGANMSLGQRQLICFARAFLADPRIFMLDEATSAVDTATELLVQQSLERLRAGRTTFIVAHRLSTILRADCILVIDQGRIVERGVHAALLAAGGRYTHLYEQFVRHTD